MVKFRSDILKLAVFATGLSGIVAEYILSTLATYFLGDSVLQWTLIVSVMLFSMGLGSRISKYIEGFVLEKFIFIEFALSIIVSFSSLVAYLSAAFTIYAGFIIYSMSILIGLLIGMEIPLVIRLNNNFQELKINISSVMEKDYYGSLAGGLFFAFVGLPFLGMTYTPFVLGLVNFLVAFLLFVMVRKGVERKKKKWLSFLSAGVFLVLVSGFFLAEPIIIFGEQKKYKDKVIYSEQSRYQKIVMTCWKQNYWLFINGSQQLSTLDEVMYHEPLVHPVMKLSKTPYHVLVMGGGDGCAVREILKHDKVKDITLVDLDPAMTELGKNHPVLKELNKGSLWNEKVKIHNQDGYHFLEQSNEFFDVIIIDLPDPKSVELGRLYSYEFYKLCHRHLRPNGLIVTQSGSPYYATRAFRCIGETMKKAGFNVQPMHNQVLTLGEWGWTLGAKNIPDSLLKKKLQNIIFEDINTRWINNEAMHLITSFGKDFFVGSSDSVQVNYIHNPVLYRYYLKGNWDLY